MNEQQHPLTELDVLLQKQDDEELGRGDSRTQRPNAADGQHRKSYSIGAGGVKLPIKKRPGLHRKQMSSISQLYQSVQNINLEPIREDFESTIQNLKTTFTTELEDMDKGETGFFDMTMARSFSVIPDDIQEFGHEVGMKDGTDQQKSSGPPVAQLLMLLGAVAAVSSNSTALHMLDGVSPPMKLYWRMTASYIALLPMAVHYFRKDGIPKLSLGGWMTFLAAVLGYSIQNCLFYSALDYTSIGNAVIYANSQALLLIIGKIFVGERIHILEGIGVIVALAGAILCSKDSEESASQSEDHSSDAIFGDLMALASAVAGVGYLTFAKAVRSEMSVTVFIFSVMFFGSFVVLAYIHLDQGLSVEWSMDMHDGVFGWLDPIRFPILIYLAVVCNMIGTMGFVRAMEYFENVVIAVATLMEPLLASLIAYAFHAGLLPGTLGWIGNFVVVLGTLCVVYPSLEKGGAGMH